MRTGTVSYKLEDLKKGVIIPIGFVGENDFTKVFFDAEEIYKKYPSASVSMKVQPPKGGIYPATVTRDGNTVIWKVKEADVANRGGGELQLTFTDGETKIKTYIAKTDVKRSLAGNGPAPDPVQDWIDDAEDVLEEVEAAEIHQPIIGLDGYWYTWNQETGEYEKTNTKAQGADGHSPVLTSSKSGKTTTLYADGEQIAQIQDGEDGQGADVIDDTAGEGDTDKTWSADKLTGEFGDVLNDIQGLVDDTLSTSGKAADAKKTGDIIDEIALNGKYLESEGSSDTYYSLTTGRINNVYDLTVITDSACGNVFVPKEQMPSKFYFDDTKYKANYCFAKNGKLVANTYTAWQTSSPLTYNEPNDYDSIGINVKKLSGNYASGELNTALYKKGSTVKYFGNLATKDYVSTNIRKRLKCIYPDGFTSRIKPDVWFDGGFRADINADDYKISGTTEAWVATDGNDTTGDGTESKPYATITKALTTDAINIHIKEGTYTQGTHYETGTNLGGRNVFGHGNVVFQNDSSGHYPYSSGSVYIENITIKHGNATTGKAYHATCTGSGQTACFVDCVFCDGGENGLSVTGIDCICIGCVSYGNKLDGFNYHAKDIDGTTYIPNALEIDCVAYNNGSDQSGSDSCNGSTAHEGVQIVRINGEYHDCYGGVIAEIAESYQETTISVNFGVLAHDSTGTSTYKASFWASKNTKMYLYDCSCYGGTYDLSAIDQASIISRRLTTGRDVPSVNQAESSTVIQY